MSKFEGEWTDSEYSEILNALARMRDPMLEKHPDWLGPCVSSRLECALSLENYQKELQAEVARLREALEQIANDPHQVYDDGATGTYGIGVADGHRCAGNKARQALSQEPGAPSREGER